MSEFVSELKAAWVGNRRRRFYQATRGIMTPEERRALEDEFDRQLSEHDRQVAEKAWEEGYSVGEENAGIGMASLLTGLSAPEMKQNPYRKAVQS